MVKINAQFDSSGFEPPHITSLMSDDCDLRFAAQVVIPYGEDTPPLKEPADPTVDDCTYYQGQVRVYKDPEERKLLIWAYKPINPTYDRVLQELLGDTVYGGCGKRRAFGQVSQQAADAIIEKLLRDPSTGYGA